RHPTRVDGVEPDRLPGLPGPHPPFLLRVRLPGPAHLAHPDRLDPPRAPHPHLTRSPPSAAGRGRLRNTRPRFLRPPAHPGHLRGVALGPPTQPGPGDRVRHRALPLLVATYLGCTRLADQRLLAGHLLGGRGRGRTPQTAAVLFATRLRAA